MACFLRYCRFTPTDQAILIIQRRVSDPWRQAREEVPDTVNWAVLYKKLVTDLTGLAAQGELVEGQLPLRVLKLASACKQAKPPSWACLVRERLYPPSALLAGRDRQAALASRAVAKIAPTRLSGINLQGVFRFPVERYAADLMPSLAAPISAAVG